MLCVAASAADCWEDRSYKGSESNEGSEEDKNWENESNEEEQVCCGECMVPEGRW